MSFDLAIIGGGASGMMAGILAARRKPAINAIIIDRLDRPGKKILATGNGRCNYTNTIMDINNFHGANPEFAAPSLRRFTPEDTVHFFGELGVYPRYEAEGKVFPYSGNASAILDALRFELARLGIPLRTGTTISTLKTSKAGFEITDTDENRINARRLLIAAGGNAHPALGSDGSGYKLLSSVGHSCTALSPAITHIRTDMKELRALEGIKVTGAISAAFRNKITATLMGEILFTSVGLSGPQVFQFSCLVAENQCDGIWIDLMPELQFQEVLNLLFERRTNLGHMTMEQYFSGLLNKRVGNLISRRSGIDKLSLEVKSLADAQLYQMAEHIKSLQFNVTGLNTWKHAQVTAGGIATDKFNPETMESLLVPGLYATGEILDIFGDCGGYNLQWAWASGYTAGVSIASSL